MDIREFKEMRKNRTWQEVSEIFDVPLMTVYRWARENKYQVKRRDGKWKVISERVLAEETAS